MPPMVTNTTSTMLEARPSVAMRSAIDARGPGGPASRRIVVTMKIVAMNSSVRMMPGSTPARNSRPIACSVRIP